jgi:TonB family protein
MRTIVGIAAFGFLLLGAATASADCTRPRPGFEIPEGSSATEQDLAETQKQLFAFAEQVREYVRCLNGETSQRQIGKDEAARSQIAQAHLAKHQEAANELNGLVDCYGAQVTAFKSSGGGKQKRAVDCASFITAAQNKAQSRTPLTSELTVEASGHTTEIPGGSWLYYLVRDDTPRACGRNQSARECLYRAVHVRNDSDDVLECKGELTYAGTDTTGKGTVQSQTLVDERSTYILVESLAKLGTNAETFEAVCKPRAKLPPLKNAEGCKYQVVQPVSISDYYPPGSQEAGEEGPVVVEFTVTQKPGRPTDVRAVAGSMYQRLDEAAVKAVGDMVMSSTCGKARYRLKLNFQLDQ